MKTITFFLVLVIFLGACSSSKKTTTKKTSSHKITHSDVFRGGTSLENAIVIKLEKEAAGVEEEYKWLSQNYPGYATIRKSRASRAKKHYDIITIRTKEGQEKDIYFDITNFYGK
jgi:ABC-type glycerol-3-phosphate transport system substrate-binding protein